MEKRAIISVKSTSNLDPNEVIEVVTPGKFIVGENGFKAIYEESEISGNAPEVQVFSIRKNGRGI